VVKIPKNKKSEGDLIKDSRQIALERAMEMETGIEEGGTKVEKKEGPESLSLEKLKEKANLSDDYYDQLLRLRAEFDNYRKRINKEREEYQQAAREEVIYGLLGIIDNFERAIKAADETKSLKGVSEGVKLIHKQLSDFLSNYGVNAIEAEGKKFDPEYHEAVGHEESDKHGEDIVAEEILKGYTFKDKVLRPSMVKVAKKKNNQKEDE